MSELFARKNIEHIERQLRSPGVQSRLGKTADTLLEMTHGLYVPSVNTDGILDLRGEGTPIVALGAGDSLQLSGDALGFSEAQHRSLSKRGISAAEQDKMEASLIDRTFVIPDFATAGIARKKGLYKARGRDISVSGRPIVVLNTSAKGMNVEDNTVLAHELVHVHQRERKPFSASFEQVAHEVEANRIQAKIEAGLGLPPTKSTSIASAYEKFLANGGDLKTRAGQIEFENYLREQNLRVLPLDTTIRGINHNH